MPSAGPYTLAEIASRLGGSVAGDGSVLIAQVGSLEHAGAGQISFFSDPRYGSRLRATRAGAVVLAPESASLTSLPRIVCSNPYAFFANVARLLNPEPAPEPGVHPGAFVAPGARLAPSAWVGPGAVIGDRAVIGERSSIGAGCSIGERVEIGDDCRLYPSVVVYAGCSIGARAIVHSGAVIGADGFGFAHDDGRWLKIPQIGRVIVGDDVEIGASTTIDRGAIDDTVIGEGVKLDNQIQIGHNCRIGAHTAMAGCAAVAGGTHIGSHCRIGARASILGHLRIVDGVQVSAVTVISRSIRQPGTYTGFYPSDEHKSWARNAALVRHLAKLAERVRALEHKLASKEDKRA